MSLDVATKQAHRDYC